MRHASALLLLVAGVSFSPHSSKAQWQVDGVPVCTAASSQELPQLISDGARGAILVWEDSRSGNFNVYAQHVNVLGVAQWTADGVVVCTAPRSQTEPQIVSDGAGGAIVTWSDYRNGASFNIHAQHVDALGTPQWMANGVAICTALGDQFVAAIASDGAGGAIVSWTDYRSGADADIYAQRVNALGVPQWTTNGVALCTAAYDQFVPEIISDGAGGAFVTWTDARSGTHDDVYAQRVSSLGVAEWTGNGIALCAADSEEVYPAIVSDGAGGVIVTWEAWRSGAGSGIYTQRVNAAGVLQWTPDGVALCTAADSQQIPMIVADDAGGAIVTWMDSRSHANTDVYAQRVNAAGVLQWTPDGVALCTAVADQRYPTIASDGAGGAIVSWTDHRSGTDADIYAQRVDAAGVPQWTADGVALCTAVYAQYNPAIVSDGAAGAIVTWQDQRSGADDIYAQHVLETPNAVAIMSFDAVEVDGVVTLRSAFRSDLAVEAVNVYRGVGTEDDPLIVLKRVDDVRGDRFEYVDRDVAPGQAYRYQIGVVDGDGEFFSPIVTVSVNAITGELSQNQPNPFNPTTTIRFTLPTREDVTLAIYDTNGHLVRTLVNEVEGYGAHEVTWDGRDESGATVGSGVYFYRLHAGKLTESKKMVLLK